MDKELRKTAARQVCLAALFGAVFSLLALALAAILVKSFSLPQSSVTAIDWSVRCAAALFSGVLFIRGERSLCKGAAAGLLFAVLTLFLFAMIGGGLHIDGFFVLELVVSAILGGVGGLLGAKLRKT